MDREQMEEYFAVRKRAYDSLQLGTHIDRHRSIPVCQLLILPSFENAVSWDVIRIVVRGTARRFDAQTRLYRSCWRVDIDEQVFSSPVERLKHPRPYAPTIETDWVLADGVTELERLFEETWAVSAESKLKGGE